MVEDHPFAWGCDYQHVRLFVAAVITDTEEDIISRETQVAQPRIHRSKTLHTRPFAQMTCTLTLRHPKFHAVTWG